MIVDTGDPKIVLTAEQAEDLLAPGDRVHNFIMCGRIMMGCDYDRDDALKELRGAHLIELGGDGSKTMKHPIVVWKDQRECSFFEADMTKVEAFEEALRQC